jgi:hypothetical protein
MNMIMRTSNGDLRHNPYRKLLTVQDCIMLHRLEMDKEGGDDSQ